MSVTIENNSSLDSVEEVCKGNPLRLGVVHSCYSCIKLQCYFLSQFLGTFARVTEIVVTDFCSDNECNFVAVDLFAFRSSRRKRYTHDTMSI